MGAPFPVNDPAGRTREPPFAQSVAMCKGGADLGEARQLAKAGPGNLK